MHGSMNTEKMYFVGYICVMDLINTQKLEHIKTSNAQQAKDT